MRHAVPRRAIVRPLAGKPLDKSEQCSDWGNRPLSGRQKRYAALDARATLRVHRDLAPQVGTVAVFHAAFVLFADAAALVVAAAAAGASAGAGGVALSP